MNILAIDTSSTACSLALLMNENIVIHHEIAPLQQARIILPSINALLKSCDVTLKQLSAIAFGQGPGSFTGIRIATSVAQGLALGAKLPVIPVSSLAALAQAAFDDLGWKKLLVATDARINEIYWGMFSVENGFVQLTNIEKICHPDKADLPNTPDWYGVGNGWEIYKNQLAFNPIAIDTTRIPMASAVSRLAKIKFEKGEYLSPSKAQPIYLRNKVANSIILD